MSLERIQKNFEIMDTEYLELFDMHGRFKKESTSENKEKLLKSIFGFKKCLRSYEASLKNLWIKEGEKVEII